MARHGHGEKRKWRVTGVTRRSVTFVSPTTGKPSSIERYRVSTIKFDKPAAATVYLKAHDKPIRFPSDAHLRGGTNPTKEKP